MLHGVVLTSFNKLTSCRRQRGNSRKEGFGDVVRWEAWAERKKEECQKPIGWKLDVPL